MTFKGKPLVTFHTLNFWHFVKGFLLKYCKTYYFDAEGAIWEIKFLFGKPYCIDFRNKR